MEKVFSMANAVSFASFIFFYAYRSSNVSRLSRNPFESFPNRLFHRLDKEF